MIRAMTAQDSEAVYEIIKALHPKDAEIVKKLYISFYTQPHKKCAKDWVIEEDGQVVAFSGFTKGETETTDIFWLNWTAVREGYRRRGYARKLFQLVLEKIKELGGRKLFVSTSNEPEYAGAIAFYKSVGFEEEGILKDYYADGIDAVQFGMRL